MKAVYDKYDVNVINVSLRHAYANNESLLSWAKEEVFAFVIYYKQGTDSNAKEIVKQWTLEMTDAILSENGRWYLPYQPHATVAQFEKGYTNSSKYFEIKNQLDSTQRNVDNIYIILIIDCFHFWYEGFNVVHGNEVFLQHIGLVFS